MNKQFHDIQKNKKLPSLFIFFYEMIKDPKSLHDLPLKSNDLLSMIRSYSIYASFHEILEKMIDIRPDFAIITKDGKKHLCHMSIAASLSTAIFDAVKANPSISEYSYDGDCSLFDEISDFFNGKTVNVTDSNSEYIKNTAENLKFVFKISNELSLKKHSFHFFNAVNELPKSITICSNENEYHTNYLIAAALSNSIRKAVNESNELKFQLDESDDISEILDFLNGSALNINAMNFDLIKKIFFELEIHSLDEVFSAIGEYYLLSFHGLILANLQSTINDLNESNIDSIFQILANSDYVKNPNYHDELIKAIETAYSIRPTHFKSFIKLVELIDQHNNQFHQSLMDYFRLARRSGTTKVSFLRSVYDAQIINYDELKELLKIEHFDKSGYSYDTSSQLMIEKSQMIIYFAHEFNDILGDEEFDHAIKSAPRYPYDLIDIFQHRDDDNSWTKFDQIIQMHHRPNELVKAIFDDNVDLLQQLTSSTDFDFNKKIASFQFDPCNEISNEISYLNLAAFYGSTSCFKFLILQNGIDLTDSAVYAVMGGSPEIIRNLVNEGVEFGNEAFVGAIKYHRYDIFQWLLTNYPSPTNIYKTRNSQTQPPLFSLSVRSLNYPAFLYFANMGIDKANAYTPTEFTLIGNATQSLNTYVIEYLGNFKDIDINLIHTKISPTLLYFAVQINCIKMIKIILNSKSLVINGKSEFNPLIFASKNGNKDIVQILAPYYKEFINDEYIKNAANEEIKQILETARNT